MISDLRKIYQSALGEINASSLIHQKFSMDGSRLLLEQQGQTFSWDLFFFKKIYLIAVGKAAYPMAKSLHQLLRTKIDGGLVITKKGYGGPPFELPIDFTIIETSHPYPDANSRKAALRLIEFLSTKDNKKNLFLFLISGGSSALVALPAGEITLPEKAETHKLLINSGADIHEINIVRKQISAIKGGRLIKSLRKAKILSFAISDVIGDDPQSIGSGLTYHDQSNAEQALAIVEKYRLQDKLPSPVLAHLLKEKKNQTNLSLSQAEYLKKKAEYHIIANISIMLEAARQQAENLGYQSRILGNDFAQPVEKMAEFLCSILETEMISTKDKKTPYKICLLAGGESTVKPDSSAGKGGRNQHLILHCLFYFKKLNKNLDYKNKEKFILAAIGSDGNDGATDAAGAYINEESHLLYQDLFRQGKIEELEKALKGFNSYPFFKQLGSLIKTGPTESNVMDLSLLLLHRH